jgi:hypothetical protein
MTHQLPVRPPADELARAPWRKSSRSNSASGCVEVAHLTDYVGVRDSKDPHGPVQLYTPRQWTRLIAGVRTGAFGCEPGNFLHRLRYCL